MATISINVEQYINDCPPWDEPIDETLTPELAQEITRRFDSTEIYNQIDELCCAILRERDIKSSAPAQAGE